MSAEFELISETPVWLAASLASRGNAGIIALGRLMLLCKRQIIHSYVVSQLLEAHVMPCG